jgi:hypothetical protein
VYIAGWNQVTANPRVSPAEAAVLKHSKATASAVSGLFHRIFTIASSRCHRRVMPGTYPMPQFIRTLHETKGIGAERGAWDIARFVTVRPLSCPNALSLELDGFEAVIAGRMGTIYVSDQHYL